MLSVTGASGAALLVLGVELGAAGAVGAVGVANAATPTASNLAAKPDLAAKPAANPGAKATVKGSQGNYTASVFVAASAKRAWSVLTNYEAMAGVMPDIKEAKVVRRSGATLELQQTYLAPYTFGRRIKATLAMQETAPRQLSYQLIKGDQIRQLKGTWTITPVSGGVLLRHQIQVDPEIPGFVRPLYYELTEANLQQSMQILKRLIEKG